MAMSAAERIKWMQEKQMQLNGGTAKVEPIEDKPVNVAAMTGDKQKDEDIVAEKASKADTNFDQNDAAPDSTDTGFNSGKDTKFTFRSELINDVVETIHSHSVADYGRIAAKVIQDIGFLLSYGGFSNRQLEFYILDLSNSGRGKSETVKLSQMLLLDEVFKRQTDKAKDAINGYKEAKAVAKGKDAKDAIPEPKLHKAIHGSGSPEALFESFESSRAQLCNFDELGLKLKKQDASIDFICEQHAKKSVTLPNFKNARFNPTQKIDGCALFFHGSSNIAYLGEQTFMHHLQGGLVNRCLLLHSGYKRPFEDRPITYTPLRKDAFTFKVEALLEFAEKYGNCDILPYTTNDAYRLYTGELYKLQDKLESSGDVFYHLYLRCEYNLKSIINILHLISCYEADSYTPNVSTETIQEGISFMRTILGVYTRIQSEIKPVTAKAGDKSLESKIDEYIRTVKLPVSMRDVYRNRCTKLELLTIIDGRYRYNDSEILSLI